MESGLLPILLFIAASSALAVGMLVAGSLVGPRRQTAVKQMPYESGMDPIHDAHRRFDVRFNLVAVAFLVELAALKGRDRLREYNVVSLIRF